MLRETLSLGGREVVIETGEIARQAGGAALIRAGDTVLLATVTCDRKPKEISFLPLTVEYRQRLSAAGRIPGSFNRREGRSSEAETLISRIVDRSLRPLFASGWSYETQIVIEPLSYDPDTDIPVLAVLGAAAAVELSPVAFEGPVGAVRVGRRDGEPIVFASPDDLQAGDLDLLITATREGIVMLEGRAGELPEADLLAAFELGQAALGPMHEALDRLREGAGRSKQRVPPVTCDETLRARVVDLAEADLRAALAVADKQERAEATRAATAAALRQLAEDGDPHRFAQAAEAKEHLGALKRRLLREAVLRGERIGGRASTEVRSITGRTGWLPRCHGSSLFTRGETQAVVSCTLGGDRDAQTLETLDGRESRTFLLHYNFPAYSVGEVRPMRGPGRREIGHGALARRALLPVLPEREEAPFTIRVISTITESNGSSSMATVCGATLAMLDAGLPLKAPVAGIAMGLVGEGGRYVVLSDILGDEDHVGDMDFKVAGTAVGVTAIQLDNKLGALPDEVMQQALSQARAGRLEILEAMAAIRSEPRRDGTGHAPRAEVVRIERNRIRDLIGTGGKNIKAVQADTGVQIDVAQDGLVKLCSNDSEAIAEAKRRVAQLTGIPRLGETYPARVVTCKEFGAFVRIFEGIDGLLQERDLDIGAEVLVEVTGVTTKGRLQLRRVSAT